ncbi:putative transcription initiation factor TFIID, 31kD subunit [Aspergillus ibericus CBS 121593]|uniref:TFIID-31kDa-domain-containing protein n=1 Tax=Aspergillus ibericus CBS 121593 TaxID=1448316 RepID=A0A395HBH8_9EURO|nr:TFIID-31kDa-domain-containing protein [Aspergillus ibericus CBS 121593]RAL05291.1 TFIID-31kDa-domain-containing protein [Aspergillus ibericus CBS 121593]
MASPTHGQPPTTQPITPPAEPSSTQPTATQTSNTTTTAPNPTTSTSTSTNPPNTSNAAPIAQPTQIPSTSLKDTGKSRRPRDVRLIHMLLSSLGVTAYQERVPLQLLDFAYRYTSSVLQDAVHLATEGYAGTTDPGSSTRGASEVNTVSLPALRLAIASRLHYQFQAGLPKEFLMDVAAERNRVALPGASRGFDNLGAVKQGQANQSVVMGGMRLPPERFCLTGLGWGMKGEWESEGEEEEEEVEVGEGGVGGGSGAGGRENGLVGVKGEDDEGGEGDEDEDGKMEDVFGEDTVMGEGDGAGGGDGDGDKAMTDV